MTRPFPAGRLELLPLGPELVAALLAGAPTDLRAGAGWPAAETLADFALDDPAGGRARLYARLRATGEVVGDAFWSGAPDRAGAVEIGFALAEPYRGRGYGRELVAGLAGWCLGQPGVRRLDAWVRPGNVASLRALAAAGFRPTDDAGAGLRRHSLDQPGRHRVAANR